MSDRHPDSPSQTLQEQNELRHRIAFAERQFVCFQTRAILAMSEENYEVARNFTRHMEECNETLDRMRRELEPGTEP